MTTDPVCGMKIEEASAHAELEHEGTPYYFCSDICREKFERHPERYALSAQEPFAPT
jgi:Cu+-exporting ATPase